MSNQKENIQPAIAEIAEIAGQLADVPNEIFDLCWFFVGSCPCKNFGTLWNQKHRPESPIVGVSGYCVRCTGDICDVCSKECSSNGRSWCGHCKGCDFKTSDWYDNEAKDFCENSKDCQNTIGLCNDCRNTIKKINPASKTRSDLCAQGFCVSYCGPCRATRNVRCPTQCAHCNKIKPARFQKQCKSCGVYPICGDCELICNNGIPHIDTNENYCPTYGADGYIVGWRDWRDDPRLCKWKKHATKTAETVYFCKVCGHNCRECDALECPTCASWRCECGDAIKCVSASGVCDTCQTLRCGKCIASVVWHEETCRETVYQGCGLGYRLKCYTCKYCVGKRKNSITNLQDCDCNECV